MGHSGQLQFFLYVIVLYVLESYRSVHLSHKTSLPLGYVVERRHEGKRGIALEYIYIIFYIYVARGVAYLGCKVAAVVIYTLDEERVGCLDSSKRNAGHT